MRQYRGLGSYSDLPAHAHGLSSVGPTGQTVGSSRSESLRDILGFAATAEPVDARIDDEWLRDGLHGEAVSWSVGYGPRTEAYVLRPGGDGRFPGTVVLHDHGSFMYRGKEKVADGPGGPDEVVRELRAAAYSGRAIANELAYRGFTVLCHDVFLWGSRRFDAQVLADSTAVEGSGTVTTQESIDASHVTYNRLAAAHENIVAKYCALLGVSLAGVIAYEDRIAAAYLRGRADVDAGPLGCLGLSGGGLRSAILNSTSEHIGAAVIVGMMSTFDELLDRNVGPHSWMLFTQGLSTFGDWPDLAGCRAPTPLLVQYLSNDRNFTLAGMRRADQLLSEIYSRSGDAEAYEGQFYPGPHRFDADMQARAFRWLEHQFRSDNVVSPD